MPTELLQNYWGGLYWLLAIVVTLTVHELAHATAAHLLNDSTPQKNGRLTLNPLAHIDPLGFFLFLIFGFGWAKPVEFDPTQLRYRKFGSTLVALAGPAANLILLSGTILIAKFFNSNLQSLFLSFIIANSLFIIINLIPMPPFDGSKLLLDLLNKFNLDQAAKLITNYGQYAFMALLLLDGTIGFKLFPLLLNSLIAWGRYLAELNY